MRMRLNKGPKRRHTPRPAHSSQASLRVNAAILRISRQTIVFVLHYIYTPTIHDNIVFLSHKSHFMLVLPFSDKRIGIYKSPFSLKGSSPLLSDRTVSMFLFSSSHHITRITQWGCIIVYFRTSLIYAAQSRLLLSASYPPTHTMLWSMGFDRCCYYYCFTCPLARPSAPNVRERKTFVNRPFLIQCSLSVNNRKKKRQPLVTHGSLGQSKCHCQC
uniref:Uncharacterized protein n=1 Tax=Anopheles albimanus TaxID=7167 RepID=A0A182FHM6_ANOAL